MRKGEKPTGLQKVIIFWPFLVLVLICLSLLWGATLLEDRLLGKLKNRFLNDVTTYQAAFENHTEGYGKILSRLESFLVQNSEVTQHDFNKEVTELARSEDFKGISYVAYAKKIPAEAATDEIIKMRSDTSASPEGYPAFKLFPTKRTGTYYSVTHIQPYASDLHGFDLSSELEITEATNVALETDKVAATSKIRFFRDKEGFLLLAPIYQSGVAVESAEQREAALIGYATLWFWQYDIFPQIENDPSIQHILDYVVNDLEPNRDEKSILHSKGEADSSEGTFYSSQLTLESERSIKVADHIWEVKFTPSPGYIRTSESSRPLIFYGIAWFVSLILGLVARRVYINTKHRVYSYPVTEEEKSE